MQDDAVSPFEVLLRILGHKIFDLAVTPVGKCICLHLYRERKSGPGGARRGDGRSGGAVVEIEPVLPAVGQIKEAANELVTPLSIFTPKLKSPVQSLRFFELIGVVSDPLQQLHVGDSRVEARS